MSVDQDHLLELPVLAVLLTYRQDGTAVSSPVWFRATEATLEVVIAEGDVKLRHLRRDPRCSLLVFENRAPFRGARFEGRGELAVDRGDVTRLSIATRYLGPDKGAQFCRDRPAGVVLSLPRAGGREWDLRAILP
ncbi:pyridoxamine 5'-phosphate oxidase family protein [Nocardioides sp.]|uniref:pyridoxamine 5'-phosphate oxidase family protein n=1 Tax=Nocardioides sp. TaxID=35761 RepID=UPI0035B1A3C3